jgi:[ribosomal protein S18]-alanine N-acetyltransferase
MVKININNIKYIYTKKEELDIILDLEKILFKDPWSFEMYCSSLNNLNTILIHCVYNNKAIAFILAEFIIDELHIHKIAVLKPYRRLKIASFLFYKLIYDIKTKNKINNFKLLLELNVNNKDAFNFYKKLGFKVINTRKNYYSNGDNAYNMSCKSENLTFNKFLKQSINNND